MTFVHLPFSKASEVSTFNQPNEKDTVYGAPLLFKNPSECDKPHFCSCGTTKNHSHGCMCVCPWLTILPNSSNFTLWMEAQILMDSYPTLPEVIMLPEKWKKTEHLLTRKKRIFDRSIHLFINISPIKPSTEDFWTEHAHTFIFIS